MHGKDRRPYAVKKHAPSRGHFVAKPLGGGFGCLELVLYGKRVLTEQHYEPSRPMRSKHPWPSTNESGED